MIFAHEKIREARKVFIFLAVGLFVTLGAIGIMWWWGAVVTGNEAIAWTIEVPALFTAFLTFMVGAIIRGLEIHTSGMDIERMDEYEVDQTISYLMKKRRALKQSKEDGEDAFTGRS